MNDDLYIWGQQLAQCDQGEGTLHLTSPMTGRSCAIQTKNGTPIFISFPGTKPKIDTIAFPGVKPKLRMGVDGDESAGEGDIEEFLSIPTQGAPWHVGTVPDSNMAFISFGGEKPRRLHLDMGDLAWMVHTDVTGQNLKLSLGQHTGVNSLPGLG